MRINFKSISHIQSEARNQTKNLSFKNTIEEKSNTTWNLPPRVLRPEEIRSLKYDMNKIKEKIKNDDKNSEGNPTETSPEAIQTTEIPVIESSPKPMPATKIPATVSSFKPMPVTETPPQKENSRAEAQKIINKSSEDHPLFNSKKEIFVEKGSLESKNLSNPCVTITIPANNEIVKKLETFLNKKLPETANYERIEHKFVYKYNVYELTNDQKEKLVKYLNQNTKDFPVLKAEIPSEEGQTV